MSLVVTRRGAEPRTAVRLAAILVLGASWLAPADRLTSVAWAREVAKPNDPLFKYQWNLQAIQIPRAWEVSRGAGAIVAVLDTGVAYQTRGKYRRAPDLAGTRFVRGRDFVDDDDRPNDEAPGDRRSHGTHIAGIIAQTTGNGIGGAGVAPEAAIMPLRVLKADRSGSPRSIARGLRFAADNGADVANLSIAGPSGSRVLADAIDYASSKGVTLVAAAGNDGRPSVSFPAAYPKVIAVGAVGRVNKGRAYYSNFGQALDVMAPGGDGRIDTTGYGTDDGVVAQTLKGGPSTFCYCFMASTSAAAAQVSGAAALLIASGRASTPAQVRAALLSSAKDLGPAGRDPQYGAGLLQASRALGPANDTSSAPKPVKGTSSSGRPWFAWLALPLALLGLAALVLLFLARRGRRTAD
jgi:serine protease